MSNDYITTYSGIRFYPLEPNIQDIKITDIAQSLSLMCRANGHYEHFFSVAQHCLGCAEEAEARGYSKRIQLACLLHDSSEAYISDVTRPVKKNLPQYCEMEANLQCTIWSAFDLHDLTDEEMKLVSEIDDALLYHEFFALKGERLFEVEPELSSNPDFSLRGFGEVRAEFLSCFDALIEHTRKDMSVGIDWCSGSWVAIAIKEDGFEVGNFLTIGDICKKYSTAASMIVDMPVGLPESDSDIRPNGAVRKLLIGNESSVFSTPCRQAVYAKDEQEAILYNEQVLHKGLSRQSLNIAKTIKQVDAFLNSNPQWKNRLVESHPELCFKILNSGNLIHESKTEHIGQQLRIDMLSRYYSLTCEVLEKFLSDAPHNKRLDDVIDALCLAVCGKLGLENGFLTIPPEPMEDRMGIKMQMVIPNL